MQLSNTTALPVLVVDDEEGARASFQRTLRSGGIQEVICCGDSREVMGLLAEREIGAVLLDLAMPHISGQELLPMISEEQPQVPIIVITGFNEVEVAVQCMQAGAFDYMVKPVENSRMLSGVRRALELRELRNEYGQLKDRLLHGTLEHPEAFAEIITNNKAMHSIAQYIETIAKTSKPVLVTGETGVGKELVARAIHLVSGLDKPMVDLNVAGLDDSVFSDTLFGHVKGAYTGADEVRSGLIEQAAGGTLLMDEIGDLSSSSQIKLLRLLQEHKYFALGSDVAKRSQVRFIFTTNRDIEALVKEGKFRKDIYYRLRTHRVHIPPLRDRLDDLPLLVDHFLEKAAEDLGRKTPSVPRELNLLLRTYSFSGNIRELESMVFDIVSSHNTPMLPLEPFKNYISGTESSVPMESSSRGQEQTKSGPLALGEDFPTLGETTQFLITEALERADGNLGIAAHLLGISRQALSKRLKRASEP